MIGPRFSSPQLGKQPRQLFMRDTCGAADQTKAQSIIHPSIHPSIHPPIHPSTHPLIGPSSPQLNIASSMPSVYKNHVWCKNLGQWQQAMASGFVASGNLHFLRTICFHSSSLLQSYMFTPHDSPHRVRMIQRASEKKRRNQVDRGSEEKEKEKRKSNRVEGWRGTAVFFSWPGIVNDRGC